MCSKTQGYYQNSKDIELVKRSDGWYFMVAGYTSPHGYQTVIEAKLQAETWLAFNNLLNFS